MIFYHNNRKVSNILGFLCWNWNVDHKMWWCHSISLSPSYLMLLLSCLHHHEELCTQSVSHSELLLELLLLGFFFFHSSKESSKYMWQWWCFLVIWPIYIVILCYFVLVFIKDSSEKKDMGKGWMKQYLQRTEHISENF